jgi:hypothetical protein
MLFLLLSIVCSVLLGFMFKLYGKYGVVSFQAIVFNYASCVCGGWLSTINWVGFSWALLAIILMLL